jgi:nucleotide-binding universal stress UspA family protein
MAYKTILVHMSAEHRARGLAATAAALAKAQGAHLIGLAVLPPVIVVPGVDSMPGDVVEEHRTAYQGEIERMKEIFTQVTAPAGITAEWQALDGQEENPFGDVASILVNRARAADLAIAAQSNPDWSLSPYLDVAEPLILETGRPVLLLPKSTTTALSVRRALVAWNGGREATRAVFDALPLLQAAEQVTIAWVDPEASGAAAPGVAGEDIAAVLGRHGVKCNAQPITSGPAGAGATLLNTAERAGCDLLVMGCYGHSRLREFIFGGVTRHVMEHMKIPVLMSH